MRLSKLLQVLNGLAKEKNISEPYIVGGLPRDKTFGLITEVKDIDLTTGDKDSFALAINASKVWPDAHFRSYRDGHSSLDFKNIRIDFSNNFNLPNIEEYLKKAGIDNPTELQKEIYSRDFTINTLLQPMDLTKDPIDITGYALDDIKNKLLRTPVDPELTIGYDYRRILRALKFVLKFDLEVSSDLKKAIVKHRGGISELPIGNIKKQVNQMLKINPKKTINLLSEFKLLPIIPLSKLMNLELSRNRMIQHLLED
jgi:tRNA nucleotidyltransferase/poly(A) polymerase